MKLSFIIPVYNTEQWLPACLDSLLCSCPAPSEYEIVAVNDGSTDSCGSILSDYQKRFPEMLNVVTTPNGGLGHARNTGIERARGDYLVFLDSDDRLAPQAVEEMLQLIREHSDSFDVAVFDIVYVDAEGQRLRVLSGCEGAEPLTDRGKKAEQDRLARAGTTVFSLNQVPTLLFSPHNAVNKIWSSSLFRDSGIRFPDRLWFEDLATVPKLYLHTDRILPVSRPWYLYLQRQGSIMLSGAAVERNREMICVADEVLDYYRRMERYDRFAPELEYKFFYEEYLSAVTRVSLGDPNSPVQAALRDDYLARFPNYRDNPYVLDAPLRYRLLDRMIRAGKWRAVRSMMMLNHQLKKRKGSKK